MIHIETFFQMGRGVLAEPLSVGSALLFMVGRRSLHELTMLRQRHGSPVTVRPTRIYRKTVN